MALRSGLVRQVAADLLRLWEHGFVHRAVRATFLPGYAVEAQRLGDDRGSAWKVVLVL